MAIEEGDALATRGLVSVISDVNGFDIFADALATRGYLYTKLDISIALGLVTIYGASLLVKQVDGKSILTKELSGESHLVKLITGKSLLDRE